MNTQPEALRLADKLLDLSTMFKTPSHEKGVCNGAIQELRRLYHLDQLRIQHIQEWKNSWDRLHALNAELLEACKAALSDDQPYIEKCKAAIAKAEGP